MVNEIIKGLSRALYDNFEGVTIYVDNVEQGFKTPSFFIRMVSASETPLIGNRAKRNCSFGIYYFPKKDSNEEIQRVASQLYAILRQIKLLNGDSLNGLKLEHEIVDGTLMFFVQFKPIVYYPYDKADGMNDLNYNFK